MNPFTEGFDLIYSYTRKQAIADGVLIDVTFAAKDLGFKYPVAVTDSVWHRYIMYEDAIGQDSMGRLWDLLWMFKVAASQCKGDLLFFEVSFIMKDGLEEIVKLKALCSAGDNLEPVITVMLPEED